MKADPNNTGFVKWPVCVINGESITPERAVEVIRRTDRFFSGQFEGGNDNKFNETAREVVKMPPYDKDKNWWENYGLFNEWAEKWGLVQLNYLHNHWVSSAYIGGPHGWCCPDGTIHFQSSIGKWPEFDEVEHDLKNIASAFPFLKFDCSVLNGEGFEADLYPVVTWHVEDGAAEIVDTLSMDRLIIKETENFDIVLERSLSGELGETYFPLSQIHEWSEQIFKEP